MAELRFSHARAEKIALDLAEAERAVDWNFNCGPAALCAVTGLTPEQVRPHLGDFESKGYTNPTLMWAALRSLGVNFRTTVTPKQNAPIASQIGPWVWPKFGLARVQWGGPWIGIGVPIQARYRKTHWVACHADLDGFRIFDINAMCVGGWLPLAEWSGQLVPWLLNEVEPKANGAWWLTHSVEVIDG